MMVSKRTRMNWYIDPRHRDDPDSGGRRENHDVHRPGYVNQLRQISNRHDRTVSRTLRRIVIDALTRRGASTAGRATSL